MGMEVCKAGQPHPSVRVREGQGDAVGAGLRDRVSPFNVGVHGVGGLGGAVHPGGRHGVLVVVPGDLGQRRVNSVVGPETMATDEVKLIKQTGATL